MEGISKEKNLPKIDDHTPFVHLERSKEIVNTSAVFYDLPGHPELVVRKCYTDMADDLTNKEKIEKLVEKSTDFCLIGKRYHLPILKPRYLIGVSPESGKPELFAVTDRVKGEDLSEMPVISGKLEREIDEIYAGIFSHLKDSYLEKGPFWKDFKNTQVMCGTKEEEKELHSYIIDIDPLIVFWPDPDKEEEEEWKERVLREKNYFFWGRFEFYLNSMKEVERRLPSRNFEKARAVLEKIIKDIPEPNNEGGKKMRWNLIEQIKK